MNLPQTTVDVMMVLSSCSGLLELSAWDSYAHAGQGPRMKPVREYLGKSSMEVSHPLQL